MAAVMADEARVATAIKPYMARVSIAAINGPDNTVISGSFGAEIDAHHAAAVRERRDQGHASIRLARLSFASARSHVG